MLRDFGLGPLRAAKEGGAHYRHTEKADLSYSWLEGLKGYLVLGHETALTFRGSSFIKAELNLGLGFEKDYSGLPPGYRILLGLGGGDFRPLPVLGPDRPRGGYPGRGAGRSRPPGPRRPPESSAPVAAFSVDFSFLTGVYLEGH